MIGDTVNVASRLEQFAEPGAVVMGENTFRLVRGGVPGEAFLAFNLKGKTEPVVAYQVEGRNIFPGPA